MDTEAVLAFLRDNDDEWTWWEAIHVVSLLCHKPEVVAESFLGGLLHDGRVRFDAGASLCARSRLDAHQPYHSGRPVIALHKVASSPGGQRKAPAIEPARSDGRRKSVATLAARSSHLGGAR